MPIKQVNWELGAVFDGFAIYYRLPIFLLSQDQDISRLERLVERIVDTAAIQIDHSQYLDQVIVVLAAIPYLSTCLSFVTVVLAE